MFDWASKSTCSMNAEDSHVCNMLDLSTGCWMLTLEMKDALTPETHYETSNKIKNVA